MNSSSVFYLILLASLVSFAAALPYQDTNKATIWFQKEYGSFFKPNAEDGTPPVIYGVSVSPTTLKIGDPRSEINALVYDSGGIRMVHADVAGRMNIMLDLDMDNRYTGQCGSNLLPGTYNVTIVAIDRAGNAAKDESRTITIRDPNDLNGNGIQDCLEKQGPQDLRVIVLHDGNLSGVAGDKLGVLPGSSVTIPRAKLEELSRMKGVKGIYEDTELKILATPRGRPPVQRDGPRPRAGEGFRGDGVTVALIDTGADPNHESLKGKIIAFHDLVNGQDQPYDDNGHGTHCASLIAGNDGIGVAPGARLVVVKVMNREGSCNTSDASRALDWCLENKKRYGIRIISFSVGGGSPSKSNPILDDACNRMVEEGFVMCVAAGNSGPDPGSIVIPGDAEKVITVGAIDANGDIYQSSSRGPTASGEIKPDLVTLGVDVVSALAQTESGTSSMSGTSMAVPLVSGAAAILLQAQPDLNASDVKRILLKTADDLGPPDPDNIYGHGALNLTKALESIRVKPESLQPPQLKPMKLISASNNCEGPGQECEGKVGDLVRIEAEASGDIKSVSSNITGSGRTLDIPMDDLDANGIYSAYWETSFWTPGDYEVKVNLQGRFGEVASQTVPFHLSGRE